MSKKKKKTTRIAGSSDTRIGFPRRKPGKKPHRLLGGGGPRRESYRTLAEAQREVTRWRKRGKKARIAEKYPSIRKYVVEVER